MGCCAPSALAVVHQLRSTFFLFFWTRRCVQHSGTSVRGRFFLVSLRRRDVSLLHTCAGLFDVSFSRGMAAAPVARVKCGVLMA